MAGTWLEGDTAWQVPFERTALECVDAQPGCGLVGVLPHGACGLVETARIVRYMAGESAGQCGPCVSGLPLIGRACDDLGEGKLRRRGLRRLRSLCGLVFGSGACSHPDGVARLVQSTLDVFEDDVVRHLAGRPCRASNHPPVFPVPTPPMRLTRYGDECTSCGSIRPAAVAMPSVHCSSRRELNWTAGVMDGL